MYCRNPYFGIFSSSTHLVPSCCLYAHSLLWCPFYKNCQRMDGPIKYCLKKDFDVSLKGFLCLHQRFLWVLFLEGFLWCVLQRIFYVYLVIWRFRLCSWKRNFCPASKGLWCPCFWKVLIWVLDDGFNSLPKL